MPDVTIKLQGCDEATYIPIAVTDEQQAFLGAVTQLSKAYSTYACEPTMEILLGLYDADGEPTGGQSDG